MKFNSKSYLYYALEDKLVITDFLIKNKFDTLGEFNIRPGSINVVGNQNDYKRYLTADFTFNDYTDCILSKLYPIDTEIMLHYRSSLSYIRLLLERSVLKFIFMSQNNGLYLFNSEMFSEIDRTYYPMIIYYDNAVLECLLNEYGLEEEEILKQDYYSLKKIGFEPDEYTYAKWDELGSNNYKEFVVKILNEYSKDDLFNVLNSINKEKEINKKLILK